MAKLKETSQYKERGGKEMAKKKEGNKNRGAYGEGHLYPRGKRGIYHYKFSYEGRAYYGNTGTPDKAEAKKTLKIKMAEVIKNEGKLIASKKTSFAKLSDAIRADYEANDKDEKRLEASIKNLKPFFKYYTARKISTAAVNKYIGQRLKDGAANATINRETSALRRMLQLAYDEDLIDKVPKIPRLDENNVREKFFTDKEIDALRAELLKRGHYYLEGAFALACQTGWRRGVIFNLKWEFVNRKENTIRIPADTPGIKNKTPIEIYMWNEIGEIIDDRWKKRALGCEYVFHRNGHRVSNHYNDWRPACKAVGLEGMRLHDCRRVGVRNLDRDGVTSQKAMRVTGHRTSSIYQRYNIVTLADMKDIARLKEKAAAERRQERKNA